MIAARGKIRQAAKMGNLVNTARAASHHAAAVATDSSRDPGYYSSDEYQYLQHSLVPMRKFEPSLFRLPVPKLELTLQRYLDSQRPLLSPERLEETSRIAKDFGNSEGAQLDKELRALDSANRHTSYINTPWRDLYLRDRRPVVFNHNPGIMLDFDPRPELSEMGARTASALVSSLRFFRSLREEVLKPEVFHLKPSATDNDAYWRKVRLMPGFAATPISYLLKAFPLDMSQYKNLFQTTR